MIGVTDKGLRKILESSFAATLCALLFVTCLAQDNRPVPQSRSDSNGQVFLNVTVTNKQGQILKGLSRESFTILDEDKQQEITFFNQQDIPISIGFLVDTSGSMKRRGEKTNLPILEVIKNFLPAFLNESNPLNEYFLMTFNQQPQLLTDWTQDKKAIDIGINQMVPAKGETALYDAYRQATEKIVQGKNSKKAIIVFTDGEDSVSTVGVIELKRLIQKTDAVIYAISILDSNSIGKIVLEDDFLDNRYRHGLLREVTEISGGRVYGTANEKAIADAFDAIVMELKTQYSIGFKPAGTDKKWHSIKVKVSPVEIADKAKPNSPPQKITPIVRTRKGYFAN